MLKNSGDFSFLINTGAEDANYMSYLISWFKRESMLEMVRWLGGWKCFLWLEYRFNLIIDYRQNCLLSIRSILLYFFHLYCIYFLKSVLTDIKTVKNKYFYIVLMDFVKQNLAQKYCVTNCWVLLANVKQQCYHCYCKYSLQIVGLINSIQSLKGLKLQNI